jgi:Uncharacterised nucleotidyltransferase
MTRAEVTTLLRAVAAHGLPGSLAETPIRPLDPHGWQELLVHSRRERIVPLLAQAIMTRSFPATDAQTMEVLDLHMRAMASVLSLEASLVHVAEVLERAAVPFRVLKGPAVAHLDYPDPALRDFGDIDLLIHPDDLDRTIAVLGRRGYVRRFPEPRAGFDRRFAKSVSVTNADGQQFDLHRTLAPGAFGLRLHVWMLWNEPAAHFTAGGHSFGALRSAERFIHACYHAVVGNAPPRLVPQRDIAQMLLRGSVETDRVRGLAAAWDCEAVVAHAITAAWLVLRLSDMVALSAWAARFRPGTRRERELARVTSPGYSFTAQAVDSIRAIRGARNRLAYLSALTFPHRSYLDGRHPSFTARVEHGISELFAARTLGKPLDSQRSSAGRTPMSRSQGEP